MTFLSRLKRPICDAPASMLAIILGLYVCYCAVGIVACDRWQHRSEQRLADVGFGYGVLIHAIETTGQYRVCDVHYPGVCFSAHRLPLIPYFLIGASKLVGDNVARVAVVKNIVFCGALGFGLWIVGRRSRAPVWVVVAALGLIALMPRWAMCLFEVGVEEAYVIPVLGLLCALLWFYPTPASLGRAIGYGAIIGVALAMLVFLKSSMLYWCLVVPVILLLRDRAVPACGTSAVVLLFSLLALACFTRNVSGRFTISSSWTGWNLFKGNCIYTARYYPWYNLDNLDYLGLVKADRPLRDEWDHNEYFKRRAIEFIKQRPAEFANLLLRKAWVFYGEWRPTGRNLDEPVKTGGLFRLQSMMLLFFRVVLWGAIGTAIGRVFVGLRRRNLDWVSVAYLAFLVLYSGFYVVGFAYERHVMPIVVPTCLFILAIAKARSIATDGAQVSRE